MGYLIKSNVINALEEDMHDTMMCYEGKREKDIIAFCYESMERTIEELPQYRVDNVVEDTGLTPQEIVGKMEDLRIYKEQGLTPDQITELKERDTAKPPIDIEDNYGFFVCPSCGNSIYASDDFESHKFCLNCGQRIRWEE